MLECWRWRAVNQARAQEQLRGEEREPSSQQRRSDYLSGREPGTRQDRLLLSAHQYTRGGGGEGGGGGLVACAPQIRIVVLTTFSGVEQYIVSRGGRLVA